MHETQLIHIQYSQWILLLLGDRSLVEEKTYRMHKQSDEFM